MTHSGADYVDVTAIASTGLTAKQYYIVRSTGVDTTYSNSNMTCLLCTSATGGESAAKGVLQNDPDTGQPARIRVSGLSKVVTGSTMEIGDLVACSTAGTAIISDTTGEWFFAKAESKSTAAGQIISVRLFGGVAPFMGSTA